MSDKLWAEAEKLASRPYEITIERNTLSDGRIVYLARNPSLPGCIAQGDTIDEAKAILAEVRVDYICVLLEEGLPVPVPSQIVIMTGPFTESAAVASSLSRTFHAGTEPEDSQHSTEIILQPGDHHVADATLRREF